jgi:PAS domain S-box-containing protein
MTPRIHVRPLAKIVVAVVVQTAIAVVVQTAIISPAAAQSAAVKTVLTIHWSTEEFPSTPVLDAAIREAFRSHPDILVDYFAEYLESDRFPAEEAFESLRDYIRRKYRDRHIDAVIAVADPALEFAIRYRAELFPDAPIVASVLAVPDAATRMTGSGITGLIQIVGYDETLEMALRLHPSTRQVLVVAYAPTISYADLITALQEVAPGVEVSHLGEPSVERLLEAVSDVPSDSLILYIRHSQEERGRVLFPPEIARLVSKASAVPVYGINDATIGTGVVGGIMTNRRRIGMRLGEMALRTLEGSRAQDMPFESVNLAPTFDWRQVERWGIDSARLPTGSVIRFREPTVWQLYGWYIAGAVTLLLAQTALIGALLVHRARRRRAEAALRESEAHFRIMADTAPVMIWRSGPDKMCDFFNLPWLSFTGRTLVQELGDGWSQGVHPDDFPSCLKTYTTAFDARESFSMEYRLRRHDGEYRWVLASGVPRWEADGTFAGYIGSCIDLTDRKQAERVMQETDAELSRLSRLTALGEFAASIAHEVRQPLTAILMNARTCLRGLGHSHPDLEDVKAGLLDVVAAGERAEEVIRRSRELFRHHKVESVPLDMNGIIGEAIALVSPRLRDNQVTLVTALADGLPLVSGDRIELQQVLLNLIANAIDAMEGTAPESKRIDLSSSLTSEGFVQVTVRDQGAGFEGVDVERMFMLSYTTKAAGSGVGLSVSRSIVEAHGGRLRAEQNPDQGATFSFTVPVHSSVAVAQAGLDGFGEIARVH